MEQILIIIIIVLIIAIIFTLGLYVKEMKKQTFLLTGTVNEPSYQRYAKFNEQIVPTDSKFDQKMNTILNLIKVDKLTDINEIATKAGCTYEECILKIKYLKNKRQIDTCHIDHKGGKLYPCTQEEYALLEKYKPYVYYNHLSISDIAARMPGVTGKNLAETKKKIYQEIYDLVDSDLISGVKINEVDKELVYYTVEKRKKEKDYITLSCKNCGALNDVNRGSKVRCAYCDTIIEDIVNE